MALKKTISDQNSRLQIIAAAQIMTADFDSTLI